MSILFPSILYITTNIDKYQKYRYFDLRIDFRAQRSGIGIIDMLVSIYLLFWATTRKLMTSSAGPPKFQKQPIALSVGRRVRSEARRRHTREESRRLTINARPVTSEQVRGRVCLCCSFSPVASRSRGELVSSKQVFTRAAKRAGRHSRASHWALSHGDRRDGDKNRRRAPSAASSAIGRGLTSSSASLFFSIFIFFAVLTHCLK